MAEAERVRAALVTGGSGGVGRAAAEALAARGYAVALTYRSGRARADAAVDAIAAAGGEAAAIAMDVGAADQVAAGIEAAVERFGGLDLVVHAAGGNVEWSRIGELPVDAWDSYIASDLNGTFYVVRAALPHVRARRGTFVLLSSIATQMCQARNVQGAAAKAGVEAMMRVLAREEARNGVRANVVSVGLTDTAMGRDALDRWGPERAEKIIAALPLGRMGDPAEVAGVIAFLASDEAGYITGKVIQVDGGQFIAG